MPVTHSLRRYALLAITGSSLTLGSTIGSIVFATAVARLSPAYAQSIEDFHQALEPFGMWRRSRRFGEVWVPFDRPRGWRPYTVGHWVYTDDWGWYWISEADEEDWGWITFHYGRWVIERGLGWVWVPGEQWAPAWVNWRNGESFVGWSPLPPEDVVYDYDSDPAFWTFIAPRYLVAPEMRTFYLEGPRRREVFIRTVVVNRTVPVQNRRFAVNPGIPPRFIASVVREPVPTFRVQPRVLSSNPGIAGAIAARPTELYQRGRRGANAPGGAGVTNVTRAAVVEPGAPTAPPPAIGRGDRGHFGEQPPRAAQGASGPAPGTGTAPSPAPSPPPAAAPPPSPTPPPNQGPTQSPRQSSPPAQSQPPGNERQPGIRAPAQPTPDRAPSQSGPSQSGPSQPAPSQQPVPPRQPQQVAPPQSPPPAAAPPPPAAAPKPPPPAAAPPPPAEAPKPPPAAAPKSPPPATAPPPPAAAPKPPPPSPPPPAAVAPKPPQAPPPAAAPARPPAAAPAQQPPKQPAKQPPKPGDKPDEQKK